MRISSAYNQAPDILLDKIALINSLLIEIESKKGKENKFYQDLAGIRDTMIYILKYLDDLHEIYDRSQKVAIYNKWLIEYSGQLETRLKSFETVEALSLSGSLDQTLQVVRAKLSEKSAEIQGLKK